jgi:hypothetical protein
MPIDNRSVCNNRYDDDLIEQRKISRVPEDQLSKLSDGNCYITRGIVRWIRHLIQNGEYLGSPNFLLPTRSPITEEDLNTLFIPIPEEPIIEEEIEEVSSDMYGPLNVWNMNRNSAYNPGGVYSYYNSDGTPRDELPEDNRMLDNFRGLYADIFGIEPPMEMTTDELINAIEARERDNGIRKNAKRMSRKRSARRSARRTAKRMSRKRSAKRMSRKRSAKRMSRKRSAKRMSRRRTAKRMSRRRTAKRTARRRTAKRSTKRSARRRTAKRSTKRSARRRTAKRRTAKRTARRRTAKRSAKRRSKNFLDRYNFYLDSFKF